MVPSGGTRVVNADLTMRPLSGPEVRRLADQRLDEELDQTFPASDPIPSHLDLEKNRPGLRKLRLK
jgi:hypothetical protein